MEYNGNYNTQNSLLLEKLMKYYKQNNNLTNMINIINGESEISLRIVDWFATNYSKKHYTVYKLDNNKRFKVYNDYKLHLKAYSKKRFDPFCRWDRITIPYGYDEQKKETIYVQTTIGQLNFFKWALENKVIQYIKEHYKEIENDMNSSYTHINKIKETTTRKKRHELSKSASRGLNTKKIDVIIDFN